MDAITAAAAVGTSQRAPRVTEGPGAGYSSRAMREEGGDDGNRLGRYILERRIASGGMADVYLARQTGPFGFTKTVALKVLKTDVAGDTDTVRMFLREALVAAEFQHPHLVQVYEVGTEGGKLFLAMALVRGVSVATLMHLLAAKGRSIPIPIAARICADVLDGLGYAHEAKGADGLPLELIHRDISPQNILVSVDGVVKLVDFGIARAETILGRTQGMRIKGKFSYMAPEQWEPGRAIDARADLFALGVCLYEMSTGSGRLFKGTSAPELYKAVVIDDIPPPQARVPDYPAALSHVVMGALERRVTNRFASARDMRAALLAACDDAGWSVDAAVLGKLVAFALDGQSIEDRWERIAEGKLPSPGEEVETLVTDMVDGRPSEPIPLRPVSLGPPKMSPAEPEYALGVAEVAQAAMQRQSEDSAYALGSLSPAERPAEPFPLRPASSRRTALGLVALAGWLAAGATIGLWQRANNQVRVLTARVQSEVLLPAPSSASSTGVLVLADPAAVEVAAQWSVSMRTELGVAARVESGDALARLVAGASSVALRAGPADAHSVASARAQGFELRSPASERIVGWDHAVVIVHPSNTTASVSVAQLAVIFSGVGSLNPVVTGAGTAPRALLDEAVLGRAGARLSPRAALVADEAAAVARVAQDPNAIALVRMVHLAPSVRALGVAGERGAAIAPTRDTIRGGSYPLARPLMLYTRAAPIGPTLQVVSLALGPEGQAAVERAGFIAR